MIPDLDFLKIFKSTLVVKGKVSNYSILLFSLLAANLLIAFLVSYFLG